MLFNFPMDSWDKTFEFGIDEEYSLAEYCMIRSKIPFNLEEKRIINESINRPYTFYEISKSSGKNELELQDLMLGKKL
ncbi:MAG: hypothetical protein EOP04_22790 [Proteobacteria bacterium]|nr:MAG: hypothetical protein EOP04_22790 [Pseudomonadota bacterium]